MRFLESFLGENTTPEALTKPTEPVRFGEIPTPKVLTKPTELGFGGFVSTGTLVSAAKNLKAAWQAVGVNLDAEQAANHWRVMAEWLNREPKTVRYMTKRNTK